MCTENEEIDRMRPGILAGILDQRLGVRLGTTRRLGSVDDGPPRRPAVPPSAVPSVDRPPSGLHPNRPDGPTADDRPVPTGYGTATDPNPKPNGNTDYRTVPTGNRKRNGNVTYG